MDDDHNIVDLDKATKIVINEYDENGIMIQETYGYTERVRKKETRTSKAKSLSFQK